jgi:TolB protein
LNRPNRLLIAILVGLTATNLLTGGLAIYLTLTSRSDTAGGSQMAVDSGPRIAFVSDRAGDIALYVMDADGSNVQRVSQEGAALYPAGSPTDQRVAYVQRETEPASGERAETSVYVAPLDGGEPIRVSGQASTIAPPTWSADGTRLAFLAWEESGIVVHIAMADGSGIDQTIVLPAQIEFVYRLAWSPAGDALFFLGTADPAHRTYISVPSIYLISLPDGDISSLSQAWAADWSPDGEGGVVASYQLPAPVQLVGWDQEPRDLALLEAGYPVAAAWAPDGAHIAILTTQNQSDVDGVHLIEVGTGHVTTVIQDGESWFDFLGWSPDGSLLSFTRGPMRHRPGADLPYADLWVYDPASDEVRQLTTEEGFEGMGTWVP